MRLGLDIYEFIYLNSYELFIHICICGYVCMYVYILCMYVFMYIRIHIHIYSYTYMYIYICVYLFIQGVFEWREEERWILDIGKKYFKALSVWDPIIERAKKGDRLVIPVKTGKILFFKII
jgi:hypothetical protein